MQGSRYKGFISYSHQDRATALWLLKALESYVVPSRIAASASADIAASRRLGHFFCDTEDMSASHSLSGAVDAALADSDFLIVLCSPAARQSRWVDEEIRRFKSMHGETRILALIIAGEAFAADPERECFPEALRHGVAADGTLTNSIHEPLAANLAADGKRRARLKLISGLLGVPLDELVQRDHQRQLRTLTAAAAFSFVGLVLASALAWTAFQARQESEFQRAEAEGLIEFMLTDLRERLEPVGRLDVLDAVGQRAQDYYGRRPRATLDDDSLARSVRALMMIGEIDDLRGNMSRAADTFREAYSTTAELLARAPQDTSRIYNHAQSAYWIGYFGFQRGDMEAAQQAFIEYAELAQRLIELEPANAEWQAEVGYAHTNLGAVFQMRGALRKAEDEYRASLAPFQRLAQQEPEAQLWQYELAQGYAWLATAQEGLGELSDALATREREHAIYSHLLEADGLNTEVHDKLALSELSLAELSAALGLSEDARAHVERSMAISEELVRLEPENRNWQEFLCRALLASIAYVPRDEREARIERVVEISGGVLSRDPDLLDWRELSTTARLMQILELSPAQRAAPLDALISAMTTQTDRPLPNIGPASATLLALQARARIGNASHWRRVIAHIEQKPRRWMKTDAIYAEALLAVGRVAEAQTVIETLRDAGYAHPDFVTLTQSRALAQAAEDA